MFDPRVETQLISMIAAFYKKQGPAREVLTLDEVNTPAPGPGEVRVRLRTSGINPADVKRRAGATSRPMVWPIIIPHSDGAGVIDAVGTGVTESREGQRVWVWNAQWKRPFGTAAEYATLPAEHAVPLPQQASFDVGAALGVPGLTAHRCLSVLRNIKGKRVLVYGAAGAIGQFVLQLIKARGGSATAVISSDEKAAIATELGATEVLNYRDEFFADNLRASVSAGAFDVIVDVDIGRNGGAYPNTLARHGEVVVVGSASNMHPSVDVLQLQKHGVSIHFVSGAEQPCSAREQAIEEINACLGANRLRTRVQARFELKDIAQAHEMVENGGLMGKVILAMAADAG